MARSTHTPARRWGTIEDAAAEACVSTRTVRREVAAGRIYAERISPRRIRVDLDSIAGRALTIPAAER